MAFVRPKNRWNNVDNIDLSDPVEMPRKIVFVDQAGGLWSGAQESLALLLEALPSSIEKTVVLFEHGLYEERLKDCGYRVVVHPVSAALTRASRHGPRNIWPFASGGDVLSLAGLLKQLRPDLVHTNTVKAHLIGIPAARIVGIPSIMHLRDTLAGTGRLALSSLGRIAASRTIAVSRRVAAWYSIARVDVIYNPIDVGSYAETVSSEAAREALNLPAKVPLLGIVGPIHRGKGHERFLRIFSHLSSATDAVAVIVGDTRFGDDQFETQLREYARYLGIADRVRFVPWLADPRIAYSALDVVCNCSIAEPFGRSVAEAAACHTPSVIFGDSGVAEIFADGISSEIVVPHNELDFGLRLLGLTQNRERLNEFGKSASAAVQGLTLKRHAAEVLSTYKSVRLG